MSSLPVSLSCAEQELHRLRCDAAIPYDATNPAHVGLQRELWVSGNLGPPEEFVPVSPLWLTLGFQGPDPSMDLRGVGILGLRQLHHFYQTAHLPRQACPLASASLNVTALLCRHFHLQRSFGGSSHRPCTPAVQHQMVRLAQAHRLQGMPCILDLVHATLLRALADRWRELKCTPLHFPALLCESGAQLRRALEELEGPWNTASVLCALVAETRGGSGSVPCGCVGFMAPSAGYGNTWCGALARGLCELTRVTGHA